MSAAFVRRRPTCVPAATSAGNGEFSETIRGTETYNDDNAAGGQVELSNLYDNAWRLNDGTYVLSDDANFEPYRDLGSKAGDSSGLNKAA